MTMTHYISLANLLAGLPEVLDRLTTLVRPGSGKGSKDRLHLQSSQSPPKANERPLGRLWAYRLRIQSARPEYLSAHLRRDIGLDL
jgi:hypothetical protein